MAQIKSKQIKLVNQGDMIIANSSGNGTILSKGTRKQLLQVNAAGTTLDYADLHPAKTYFVTANGDTAAGGADGSLNNPYNTIQEAIDALPADTDPANMYVIQVSVGSYGAVDLNGVTVKSLAIEGVAGVQIGALTWTTAINAEELKTLRVSNVGLDSVILAPTVATAHTALDNGANFHNVNVAGPVVVKNVQTAGLYYSSVTGSFTVENVPNMLMLKDSVISGDVGVSFVGANPKPTGAVKSYVISEGSVITGNLTISDDTGTETAVQLRNGNRVGNPAGGSVHTIGASTTLVLYGSTTIFGTVTKNGTLTHVNTWFDNEGTQFSSTNVQDTLVDIDVKLKELAGTVAGPGFSVIDSQGDLIVGTGDNEYNKLSVGAGKQVLAVNTAGNNVEYVNFGFDKTLFVSQNGSDTLGNGSLNNPLATITQALSLAVAGDTIVVAGGTYVENIDVNKAVSLKGLNSFMGAETVISGKVTVSANASMTDIKVNNPGTTATDHAMELTASGSGMHFNNVTVSTDGVGAYAVYQNNVGLQHALFVGSKIVGMIKAAGTDVTSTLKLVGCMLSEADIDASGSGTVAVDNANELKSVTHSAGTFSLSNIGQMLGNVASTATGSTNPLVLNNVNFFKKDGSGYFGLSVGAGTNYVINDVSYDPTTNLSAGTRVAYGRQARDVSFASINTGNSVREIVSPDMQAALAEVVAEATFTYKAAGATQPNADDDITKGFTVGDLFANASGSVWVCLDDTNSAAQWVRIDQGPDANLFTYIGSVDARYVSPKVGDLDPSLAVNLPASPSEGDVYEIITASGDFEGTGPTVAPGDFIGFDGTNWIKLVTGVHLPPAVKERGDYYKVSVAGTFFGDVTYIKAGDGIVWNGSGWDIIDNTNSQVTSSGNTVTVTGSTDTGFNVEVAVRFATKSYTVANASPTPGDYTRSGNVVTFEGLDLSHNGVATDTWVPEMTGINVSLNGLTVDTAAVSLSSKYVQLDETQLGFTIEATDEVTVRYAYRLA